MFNPLCSFTCMHCPLRIFFFCLACEKSHCLTKERKSLDVIRSNAFDVYIRRPFFLSSPFLGSIPTTEAFSCDVSTYTTVHAHVPLNGVELLVSLEHSLCKYVKKFRSSWCGVHLLLSPCMLLVLKFHLVKIEISRSFLHVQREPWIGENGEIELFCNRHSVSQPG